MFSATEGFSPLAAYEELMRFARKRGEAALRLALHASVPQDFQPELLHLLKRNFVPEAADDPAIEVDVLFAPFCEEMGRGYFRFDPQVRTLLLDNLASNYASEPVSRIYRVANFLLFYIDHFDRSTSGRQDQLWKDYLEIQRWVALAFIDPESAARQLAAALEHADSSNDFATRIQLGGLASALSAPLIGHRRLLNYAAGLQALELGDHQKADRLLRSLKDDEIKVGNMTLRPASKIIEDWQARHPEIRPHSGERTTENERAPEGTEQPPALGTVEELLAALRDKDSGVRRRAAEALRHIDDTSITVPALAGLLKDKDHSVRETAVRSLGAIRTEAAVSALLEAVNDVSYGVGMAAVDELAQIEGGAQNFVLIIDSYTVGDAEFLEEIKKRLRQRSFTTEPAAKPDATTNAFRSHNYWPVILDFWNTPADWLISYISRLLPLARFIIIDLLSHENYLPEIQSAISELSIPIQPITDLSVSLNETTHTFLKSPSVLPIYRYRDVADLLTHFEERVIAPLEAKLLEIQKPLSPIPTSGHLGSSVFPQKFIPEPASVPVFKRDIYISYAHLDNQPLLESSKGWVDTLQEALARRLEEFMGEEPKIWRDIKLQRSDIFRDSLLEVIQTSAIFVAIISPGYVRSEWCGRELETFVSAAERTGGLRVGTDSRIYKVVKTYVPREEQLPVAQEYLSYEFYEVDSMTGMAREFQPELGEDYQKKFLMKLEDLAHDISRTLKAIRGGDISKPGGAPFEPFPSWSPEAQAQASYPQHATSEARLPFAKNVYLAETTSDLGEERARIKNELAERGYRVLPERPLPLSMPRLQESLRDDLRQCHLSIHLIGRAYGMILEGEGTEQSLSQVQYKMAAERSADPSFSCIVWMPPEIETGDMRQKRFIAEVENASHVELLKTHFEELKSHIQYRLQQTRVLPPAEQKAPLIYLIDTPRDAQASEQIARYLSERRFQIVRTPDEDNKAKLKEHKRLLSLCDAVLIYYDTANEFWLLMKLRELQEIARLKRAQPLKATAIYIGGLLTEHKKLFLTRQALVIKNFGEFNPASLEPFLDALSHPGEPGGETL